MPGTGLRRGAARALAGDFRRTGCASGCGRPTRWSCRAPSRRSASCSLKPSRPGSVITTRCGGPEDIVEAGLGVLLERDDDEHLASAMVAVTGQSYPEERAARACEEHASASRRWRRNCWTSTRRSVWRVERRGAVLDALRGEAGPGHDWPRSAPDKMSRGRFTIESTPDSLGHYAKPPCTRSARTASWTRRTRASRSMPAAGATTATTTIGTSCRTGIPTNRRAGTGQRGRRHQA